MTGSLTAPSFIANGIDCSVDSQGTNWIRYSNGLQICWGTITWQSDCRVTVWGSLYETTPARGSYAKSFIEIPFFSASGDVGGGSAMIDSDAVTKTSTPQIWLCRAVSIDEVRHCIVRYTAFGRWK